MRLLISGRRCRSIQQGRRQSGSPSGLRVQSHIGLCDEAMIALQALDL
jgi:hypothetical protein